MFRFFIILFSACYIITAHALSDMNIIENGEIIKSKPYSVNEATLVINKSNKIYICSVLNEITKCILSVKKNKIY